ncbi:MAG: hypothetical protein KAJ37_12620 [Candidatus Krumholzibacteria bacterium]|nr:hypothetical protein [Candidatus Krumholzibacteria bacterium]
MALERREMRRLYFDIDGTFLVDDTGEPKPALADGALEAAVIRSGVEKLVCIGNFVDAARTAEEIEPSYDGLGVIFDICRGVFSDKSWFRSVTSLVKDPMNRANEVDLEGDWWYVDDLAEHYFQIAGRDAVFRRNIGGRILVPSSGGDGTDVLKWLDHIS